MIEKKTKEIDGVVLAGNISSVTAFDATLKPFTPRPAHATEQRSEPLPATTHKLNGCSKRKAVDSWLTPPMKQFGRVVDGRCNNHRCKIQTGTKWFDKDISNVPSVFTLTERIKTVNVQAVAEYMLGV